MIDMRLHDGARADFHLRADAAEGANFHILGETGAGIDQGGRMNLHKHARFLEAEIGESSFRGRTNDDMIEQFDLEQLGCLAQASR